MSSPGFLFLLRVRFESDPWCLQPLCFNKCNCVKRPLNTHTPLQKLFSLFNYLTMV